MVKREKRASSARRPSLRGTAQPGLAARGFTVDLDVSGRVRGAAAAALGVSESELADDAPVSAAVLGNEAFAELIMRLRAQFSVRISGADAVAVTTLSELTALFARALGQPGTADDLPRSLRAVDLAPNRATGSRTR